MFRPLMLTDLLCGCAEIWFLVIASIPKSKSYPGFGSTRQSRRKVGCVVFSMDTSISHFPVTYAVFPWARSSLVPSGTILAPSSLASARDMIEDSAPVSTKVSIFLG